MAEKELTELRASSSKTADELKKLTASHETLRKEHDTLSGEHSTLKTSHTDLTSTHDKLKDEHGTSSKSLKTSEASLKKTSVELEKTKTSLSQTTKRAEAAEKKRDALHNDNGELVKQLEEVRGRVVQVMEEKAELTASVDSWESRHKSLDKQRGELDTELKTAKVGCVCVGQR